MKSYSFNTSFSQLLQKIKKIKQKTIITGDLNHNLLNYAKNIGTYEFLESIFSKNFTPQINLPARITGTSSTLIDNILTYSQENIYTSGKLTTSISDQLPQFTIIENLFSDTFVKKEVKTLKRDFSKVPRDNFITNLKSVNWSRATQNNPNIGFETSCLSSTIFLTNMPPFKEQSKRKVILRFKPWITKGILTSIKQRDKTFKKMIKTKNSQNKQRKFSFYKKSIVTLLLIS